MADKTKQSKKRKAPKPHKLQNQEQAEAARVSLVGPSTIPKMKMPKLQGPYPASPLQNTGHASQGKNQPSFFFISPPGPQQNIQGKYSDFYAYRCTNTSLAAPVCLFDDKNSLNKIDQICSDVFSGRAVHSMSDSEIETDEIPDLVPHPDDAEDGEIVGDEGDYYGVLSGHQQPLQYPDDDLDYMGGTTEPFHFKGGFGRGKADFDHPQSDPTYLGVGENNSFFDKSHDNIAVFSQGENFDSYDYGDQQNSSQYESDSEEIYVEDSWQPGGPTELDEELDNVGLIQPGDSNRSHPATYGQYKNQIPSVIPPCHGKTITGYN